MPRNFLRADDVDAVPVFVKLLERVPERATLATEHGTVTGDHEEVHGSNDT
jgi:hypothetical protein